MDVGTVLKKARILKKLSLADIEEATKIRTKYLQAMEEDNFAVLPPGMYGSAFLRTYARFLELDAEELVTAYREVAGLTPVHSDDEAPYTEVRPSRWRRGVWGLVAALVIVAAGFGLFTRRALVGPAPQAPPPAANTVQNQTPQTPQTPPPSQEAAVNGVSLMLKATRQYSWYSVTVDGGTVHEGFIYAGQEKNFQANENVNVVLGNAASVKVVVNGQDLGYLGGQGARVQQTFTAGG